MMDQSAYIKKLERRIHMQRIRLRWWEDQFNSHVHGHYWSKVAGVRAHLRDVALRTGLRRIVKARRKLLTKDKETPNG